MVIKKSSKMSARQEPGTKQPMGSATHKHGVDGEARLRAARSATSKTVAGRAASVTKARKRPTRAVADKHQARSRNAVTEAEATLVMPVAAPQRDLLRQIDQIINRGSEVTLVQGKSRVQVTGETLTALRQIFAALNAGPLSLLLGDSRDTELTSQEAADLLNVSRPYVVKLAREGKIPHIRVGNRHRFLLSDIQEHNQRQRLDREQALASMTPEGGYSDEDF